MSAPPPAGVRPGREGRQGIRRRAVPRSAAAGLYEGSLRRIVHALKYRRHRSLARGLGTLMRQRGAGVLDGADVIVPVPLHPWRHWTRGFNQADDLARHLPGHRLHALCRWRRTRPQADLDVSARARNVRGAFGPSWRLRVGSWLARHSTARRSLPGRLARRLAGRWSVSGRVVVLVDDVQTTGATLEACAVVLEQWGALEVRAVTAARVAPGRAPRSPAR